MHETAGATGMVTPAGGHDVMKKKALISWPEEPGREREPERRGGEPCCREPRGGRFQHRPCRSHSRNRKHRDGERGP